MKKLFPHLNYRSRNMWIVERPGLSLDRTTLTKLEADIGTLVRRIYPGGLNYSIFTGNKAAFNNVIALMTYEQGVPVACGVMTWMTCQLGGREEDVLHTGLVLVDPRHRGKGLAHRAQRLTFLLLLLRVGLRSFWATSVSQVPAGIGLYDETFADIYPTPRRPRSSPPPEHLQVAREVMKKHRAVFGTGEVAVFDEARFVIQDSLSGGSENIKKAFEECQKHRNPIYNEFAKEHIDYERGDEVLQVFRVNANSLFKSAQVISVSHLRRVVQSSFWKNRSSCITAASKIPADLAKDTVRLAQKEE